MDYVPFLIFLLYLYMYLLCDNKRYWIEIEKNWILAGVSGCHFVNGYDLQTQIPDPCWPDLKTYPASPGRLQAVAVGPANT